MLTAFTCKNATHTLRVDIFKKTATLETREGKALKSPDFWVVNTISKANEVLKTLT